MSVFVSLGLEPIINAAGPVTRLGGAPMAAKVLEAFADAAREWVPLDQLQAAASRAIAQVTGAPAGIVTAGAAAGLTLGAAAIMTRFDLGLMDRLPDTTGLANEFVVSREQRNGYDHAIRAAGGRMVEVGFDEIAAGAGVRRTEAWEYEAAFGPRTAAVFYVYGPRSRPALEEVVKIAHRRNVPVIVDAAAQLPPRSNLRLAAITGADLVVFSGGKAIRGPQSTGILCGRRDLVGAALLQMLDTDDRFDLWTPPEELIDKRQLSGLPRQGVGRALKVSKEEIAALLTALAHFVGGYYDAKLPTYRSGLDAIVQQLAGLTSVTCFLRDSPDGESAPSLELQIDELRLGRTAVDVCRTLRSGHPPVYVGQSLLDSGRLRIDPTCVEKTQFAALAERLREALS